MPILINLEKRKRTIRCFTPIFEDVFPVAHIELGPDKKEWYTVPEFIKGLESLPER